jgi:glutamate formiminotransferase
VTAVLECIVNVSEGSRREVLAALTAAGGACLRDLHADGDHNRSVFTLAGDGPDVESAARQLATVAVERVDLGRHRGVHPRLGAVDVVPFVALELDPSGHLRDAPIGTAVAARDRFARWSAETLGVPCFLYGPDPGPSLPELRRSAWRDRWPDTGPRSPHPTAGAVCAGARPALVAYNVWLRDADVALASRLARDLRGPHVRALGLAAGGSAQVSCNLIAPWVVGPAAVRDAVARRAAVSRAELVGLLPRAVLEAVPPPRWEELDLDPGRTIEARLEQAGLDGGRFDR